MRPTWNGMKAQEDISMKESEDPVPRANGRIDQERDRCLTQGFGVVGVGWGGLSHKLLYLLL